jgi:D-ribose pyranose/furanose isomerase RbsD
MKITNKFSVTVNSQGKFKLVTPNDDAMRLYATEEELNELGEKHWYKHVEIREGEFGPYAVLILDTYEPFVFKG